MKRHDYGICLVQFVLFGIGCFTGDFIEFLNSHDHDNNWTIIGGNI